MINGDKEKKKQFGISSLDRYIINEANGKVLSKGSNLLGREFFDFKHKKIFDLVNFNNENEKKKEDVIIYDISAGKDYVLALDKNYQVWAWGSNARKQIDPFNEMKEINKPRKIGFINENSSIAQIYALDEISIAITKDKRIKIWGENKNKAFLASEINEESEIPNFVQKNNISKYIEKELLKDDFDVTESFVKARRIFNTKYNENLNTDKKSSENDDKFLDRDSENEIIVNKKITNSNQNNEKLKKNISNLEEYIHEYERGLEEINSKKNLFRIDLKVIDDQINQIKIDQEKIHKKISEIGGVSNKERNFTNEGKKNENYNMKTDKGYFIHDGNELNNEDVNAANKSMFSNNTKNNNSNLKELRDQKNLEMHGFTLTSSLDNLNVLYEIKKTERDEISCEIEKLAEQENSLFENKKVLNDLIIFLKDYGFKPEFSEQTQNNYSVIGKEDYFFGMINMLKSIEENTFLNLNTKYNKIKVNKSTEMLLSDSKTEINNISKSFFKTYSNTGEELKNKIFKTLKSLIENKLTIVDEQNNLITYLINYFNCMSDYVINSLENDYHQNDNKDFRDKNSANKNENKNNTKDKTRRIVDIFFRNKLLEHKNPETICKEMITNFIKESLGGEEFIEKEDPKSNKVNIKENKKDKNKEEYVNYDDLFDDYLKDVKMEDLIILSKFNENE